MARIKVAHIVYSYLPVTQNWIYSQLRWNRVCDHWALSLTEENPDRFPWEKRRTAFPSRTPGDRLGLLMARFWIRQPERFFASSIGQIGPDIIHGHFSTESWRILAHARNARIPLVTTFYGLDVDKLPRRRYWKIRNPVLFRYGALFFAEGPFMGRRLEAIGCPGEKVKIVPLGIDLDLYRHSSIPEERSRSRRVRVLFVGLNREKKGPLDAAAVFAAALAEYPSMELHIVGVGSYRAGVERVLSKSGSLHRAVFHGALTFDAYLDVLKMCDLLLAPSCSAADGDCEGGAPVVCIEAQAAGMPVIGTRHCDIPFVVRHRITGLLSEEHDVASMARDLALLARDSDLRRTMGEKARGHAAAQHDITLQVEKVTSAYESVLRREESGS